MLGLNKRQETSLRNLQTKVNSPFPVAVKVTEAQYKAMKIAYTNFVKSGQPVPAELVAAAKNLGIV